MSIIETGSKGIDELIGEGSLIVNGTVFVENNVVLCVLLLQEGPVILEDGCHLRSGCVIYSGCKFGRNVRIGHNSIILANTIIGEGTYIGGLVNCEGETKIGKFCGINAQSHITKHTEIGDYSFWGPMVSTVNDNRMRYRREGHGEQLVGPKFGRGVRVGSMAIILPDVKVGDNAIIGAGSVVTKDVEENTIVFGNPAVLQGVVPEEDRI